MGVGEVSEECEACRALAEMIESGRQLVLQEMRAAVRALGGYPSDDEALDIGCEHLIEVLECLDAALMFDAPETLVDGLKADAREMLVRIANDLG